MTLYREVQYFAAWVYVVTGGVCVLVLLLPYLDTLAGKTPDPVGIRVTLAVMLIVMPLTANLLRITTEVGKTEVVVTFGLFLPLYWKRFPLDGIQELRPVTYRPIRDAGGWGIRFGRFNGAPCRFLNARGDRGVLLVTTAGKQFVIGSQEPEKLAEAIQGAA